MYRQGDVLLVPVEKLPTDAKLLEGMTVALGELTGHHHTFSENAVLYQDRGTTFVVADDAPLEHQEHDTIVIPEGVYRVTRQREFDEGQIRRVAD